MTNLPPRTPPVQPDRPVTFPECIGPLYPPPAGMPWPGPEPIPFAEFCESVLDLYRPPLRAKGTYNRMRYSLDGLSSVMPEGATTADLTPATIARFIESRPATVGINTTISSLASIRTACNYAVSMGWLRVSPFAIRRQWLRRVPPARKQHHSRGEIARVLALMASDVARKTGWAQWRARRLLALAASVAYTGMRKMEALCLKVEDVDLAGRIILIIPSDRNRLKTEKSAQPIPIPEALAVILADWLPRTGCEWVFPNTFMTAPWTGGSAGYRPIDRMKRLGKRAGVQGFTFLSLRHSFATHAEFWGLSPSMIQRMLRHTSTRTQWHYRHADVPNLRAAVAGIDFVDRPEEGLTS